MTNENDPVTVVRLPSSKDIKNSNEHEIYDGLLKKPSQDVDADPQTSGLGNEEGSGDNGGSFIIRKNEMADYRVDEDHLNSTSFYSDDVRKCFSKNVSEIYLKIASDPSFAFSAAAFEDYQNFLKLLLQLESPANFYSKATLL